MDPLALADGTVWGILLAGLALGAIEGILPGPLMMVVISETMKHDWKAGARVSASVLITDGPIILATAYAWYLLSGFDVLLSTCSAVLLLWLAWKAWTTKPPQVSDEEVPDHSLRNGILTNIVNPNPYRFWGLVGAPFLVAAWTISPSAPFIFILAFFGVFILCKVSIARLVDRSRDYLDSGGYRMMMQTCSLCLVAFALGFAMRVI